MELPIYVCEALLSQLSNSVQCLSPISRLPRETIRFYADLFEQISIFRACIVLLYSLAIFG